MKRSIPFITVALLGLTACGSDTASNVQSAVSAVSNGNVADCAAVYKELTTALVAGVTPGSSVDFEKVLANTEAAVPENLKADVKVMANALVELGKKIKANPTDVNAMKDLVKALNSSEVQAASNSLKTYFDGGCA
ncbi:MAG: hypothetical protein RI900_2819 [Actinomycetota bacterium]|jgi:hypothetical protein